MADVIYGLKVVVWDSLRSWRCGRCGGVWRTGAAVWRTGAAVTDKGIGNIFAGWRFLHFLSWASVPPAMPGLVNFLVGGLSFLIGSGKTIAAWL
jgi:hypothetical protein